MCHRLPVGGLSDKNVQPAFSGLTKHWIHRPELKFDTRKKSTELGGLTPDHSPESQTDLL
jgi:hypothetical protein